MKPEDFPKRQLEQLKEAAKIFLRPMERLPFPVVIEAMTGHPVLPVMKNPQDESLLQNLSNACIETVKLSAKAAIHANRPNDVSTHVEELLEARLKTRDIRVEKPQAQEGRTPGGYPDRLIWCGNHPTYLEVKVSREENIDQGSARNFFYQPTPRSKIRYAARHLLAGFAIKEISEKTWILTRWKIVDLWFLRVKLKPEYNADNLEIYRQEAVLLEGDGHKIVKAKKE